MRLIKTISGVLVSSAFVPLALLATPTLASPTNVDPKLPKEVQPMHALVGEWRGKGTITPPGAPSQTVALHMKCEAVSGGLGISCRDDFKGPQLSALESDLFGWDAGGGKYHWYAITDGGETHDHVASPPAKEGDPIVWTYEGVMQGKPFKEVITMSFDKACKHQDFQTVGSLDGQTLYSLAGSIDKQ